MVRIGQVESMHEEVRKISLSELSRQDAMKQNHERQRACTEANEQKVNFFTFIKLILNKIYYVNLLVTKIFTSK